MRAQLAGIAILPFSGGLIRAEGQEVRGRISVRTPDVREVEREHAKAWREHVRESEKDRREAEREYLKPGGSTSGNEPSATARDGGITSG